jgi:hypothetical protein
MLFNVIGSHVKGICVKSSMQIDMSKRFLGKPCKHGHEGWRFISTGACCHCAKDIYAPTRKQYNRIYNRARGATPEHLATRLFCAARSRQAKKKPEGFSLTRDWILEKILAGKCEVTGIDFDLSLKDTARRAFAPSLDKIDPSGDYTKENCQLVCFIYNTAKGQFSHADVMRLASAVCMSR